MFKNNPKKVKDVECNNTLYTQLLQYKTIQPEPNYTPKWDVFNLQNKWVNAETEDPTEWLTEGLKQGYAWASLMKYSILPIWLLYFLPSEVRIINDTPQPSAAQLATQIPNTFQRRLGTYGNIM